LSYLTFTNDLGIDLGTANTLVYVSGKGIMLNEPSYIALDRRLDKVLATGASAKVMAGRTPSHIEVIRPLQGGVIGDARMTRELLQSLMVKVNSLSKLGIRPHLVVSVPGNITEVEKRAVRQAGLEAGATQAYLLEEPLAAAIGVGLPVNEPNASMVVDIGAGTTEVAVISLGGIVVTRSTQVAGNTLDQAIIQFARNQFNLEVGEHRAENAKINIGSAFPLEQELRYTLRGLDTVTKLPKSVEISSIELREVFSRPLQLIIETVRQVMVETPAELFADIVGNGVTLIGGGALLAGFDKRLSQEIRLPVHLPTDPLLCVARGTGIVVESLKNEKYLQVIAASQEERRYKLISRF
jgi:rod shape-determining protein MreB